MDSNLKGQMEKNIFSCCICPGPHFHSGTLFWNDYYIDHQIKLELWQYLYFVPMVFCGEFDAIGIQNLEKSEFRSNLAIHEFFMGLTQQWPLQISLENCFAIVVER